MPRDYAKQRSKPRRKYQRKKPTKSHWKLWLFTLLLLIIFIFILVHLKQRDKTKKTVKVIPIQKQIKSKITAPAVSKPQFDFYTILPKEQVKVFANKNGPQYYLQIASLKDYADADQLKAELALLGFDAYIEKIKVGKVVWNRVSVGPYSTKKAAKADQQHLKQNKIKSMLREGR